MLLEPTRESRGKRTERQLSVDGHLLGAGELLHRGERLWRLYWNPLLPASLVPS